MSFSPRIRPAVTRFHRLVERLLPAGPAGRPRTRPQLEALEDRTLLNAGGGWTGGGLVGQYYANTTFSGTPGFTRSDVRIDFASNSQAPGGSPAPGFNAVGATNFSAQWTGSLIPRYSQTYTFDGFADDRFVLQISPHGQNAWTTVVNQTAYTGQDFTGRYAFTAGQTYDVRIQLVQYGGTWAAQLRWSSPSTPEEVVEPAAPLGVNLEGLTDYSGLQLFANDMLTSRAFGSPGTPWDGSAAVDASGNPTADFGAVATDPPGGVETGTYTLSFSGLASVSPVASTATFYVNGTGYGGSLPSGVGYDPNTNTTTAQVVVPAQSQLMLAFTNTQRTAGSDTGTGLTNLVFMQPAAPGASTSLSPSTVFNPAAEQLLSGFTGIRYMDYLATNGSPIVNWTDRPTPGTAQYTLGLGGPLEYAVMLANETGKDLWVNVPEQASDDYVTRMAELIAYGSDGVNPYTSPQGNPVFPGLNPNLKVYVEFSNEVWNYAFPQATQNYNAAVADVQTGSSPLNYDGSTDVYGWARRRVAEQTVQISNIFRGVFGDGAMPGTSADPVVRPLLEWQYGNSGSTASDALNFINNYFDNADGQEHVTTPHPVNYFLWGGGGGWYFSVKNSSGLGDVSVAGGSFETPAVTDAQADPAGSGWTFSGPAGIAANGSSLGNPDAPDGTQVAYLQGAGSFSQTVTFKGGRADLAFYAAEGGSGSESFKVYYDGQLVGRDWRNDWTPDNTTFGLYHTLSFATTAGPHTLTFVGEGGDGVVEEDDVQVEDANAMFNSGLADPYATVAADSQWARAFGLHVTNYEGGFDVGGDHPTDLQKQANLDPRAQSFESQGVSRLFQAGSDLAMVYNTSGYSAYGLADPNVFNQNTPKLQAIKALMQQLPAAPNTGTALPTAVGQSVTVPEGSGYIYPAPRVAKIYMLQAAAPGVYSVTIHGTQDDAGSLEHFTLDGQRVPGATSLPYTGKGAGNSSPTLTFAVTAPGLHALALYVDGPQRIHLDGGYLTLSLVSAGTPAALPAGWADADVGSPGQAGSAVSYDGQNWTVSGGGSGIGGTSDQFHFDSQPYQGDGTALARVDSLTATDPGAGAGVMFRDGTAPGALFAAALATPGNGVAFEWRDSTGLAQTVNVTGLAAPVWVELVRQGNNFSGYYSSDGVNWTQVGSTQTVAMSPTAQVGLAVTANNNGEITTANFSGVSVPSTSAAVQLAGFNFAGTSGTQASQSPDHVATHVSVGAVSRGSGLTAGNQGYPATFGASLSSVPSAGAGDTYGTGLSSAIAKGQYVQFTMAPAAGYALSLSSLSFAAWAQVGEASFAGAVQYSTDGVHFITASAMTGSLSGAKPGSPKTLTANLSGVSALQGVRGTVTFRIYLWGAGAYEDTGIGRTFSDRDLTVLGSLTPGAA